MTEISKKKLVELFIKEYSRFCMIADLSIQNIAITEDGDCEIDECKPCKEVCSCEASCVGHCSKHIKLNIDPYEYAMLFSIVRMATYVQEILFSYYSEQTNKKNSDDLDPEEVFDWYLKSKIIESEEDISSLALFISIYYESTSIFPESDISCFSQDSDRIPLLMGEQLITIVESTASLVHTISNKL